MNQLPVKKLLTVMALAAAMLTLAGTASAQVAQVAQVADRSADGDSYKLMSFDGTYVAVKVRKPDGEGPFPAILFLHGGIGGGGEERIERIAAGPLPSFFLERGFVVMVSNYRRYHFGVEEMYDVFAAYEELERLPFVDPNRISAIGGSHGGYLVELLAMHKKPACVVSLAGIVDIEALFDRAQNLRRSFSTQEEGWAILTMDRRERAKLKPFREDSELFHQSPVAKNLILAENVFELALRFEDDKSKYTEISPLQNASRILSPLLYLSGDQDPLTANGKRLVQRMKELGKTAELSVFPGVGHGFSWGVGQVSIHPGVGGGWSWTVWQEPHAEFYKAAEKMHSFVVAHSK